MNRIGHYNQFYIAKGGQGSGVFLLSDMGGAMSQHMKSVQLTAVV